MTPGAVAETGASSPRSDFRLDRLHWFVGAIGTLLADGREESAILAAGADLVAKLVGEDDWLPPRFAEPDPDRYRQYLLHCDSRERFCVVSFVWGPGQSTPVHDHTVWGLVGMLRGAELTQRYRREGTGKLVADGPPRRLEPGAVEILSPRAGDIHRVANAYDDRVSISIHVYGANIGTVRRSSYDTTGAAKLFVSGYANDLLPNFWQTGPGYDPPESTP